MKKYKGYKYPTGLVRLRNYLERRLKRPSQSTLLLRKMAITEGVTYALTFVDLINPEIEEPPKHGSGQTDWVDSICGLK